MTAIIDQKLLLHYGILMQEAKERLAAIPRILDLAVARATDTYIPAEFCYLQLRLVCEVIGFGCLLVNEELAIVQKNKLLDETSPEVIIKALAKERPNFFPLPVRLFDMAGKNATPGMVGTLHAVPRRDREYLSRSDLKALYGVCGNVLHRGSLNRLREHSEPMSFPNIEHWMALVTNLLECHQILFPDNKRGIWCSLGADVKTKVVCSGFVFGIPPT
jgi:hypothetical protein